VFAAIAALGFLGARAAGGFAPIVPLLIALPLFALQAVFDAANRSRERFVEISAPAALAAIAPAIALAGGWTPVQAAALWLIMIARAIPAIIYVRARLRLERGEVFGRGAAIGSHIVALAAGVALAAADLAPVLGAVALGILLIRAAYGLSDLRQPAAPKTIGFQEVAFGLMFVVVSAIGYRL
jgi:hypothetical protein